MPTRKRRSGGSKARREIRQQSTKNQVVQPGQEGGTYHPLTTSENGRMEAKKRSLT